ARQWPQWFRNPRPPIRPATGRVNPRRLPQSIFSRSCNDPFLDLRLRRSRFCSTGLRQINSEDRAALGPVRRFDPAVVLLDDAASDGKAEPRALADRLGGEERVEDIWQVFGRDPDSGVRNAQRRETSPVSLRRVFQTLDA